MFKLLATVAPSLSLPRRQDWNAAIAELEAAIPLELGVEEPFANPLMIPPYLRGLAYLEGKQWKEAARELEKITERPYLLRNNPVFSLARQALARARARAS